MHHHNLSNQNPQKNPTQNLWDGRIHGLRMRATVVARFFLWCGKPNLGHKQNLGWCFRNLFGWFCGKIHELMFVGNSFKHHIGSLGGWRWFIEIRGCGKVWWELTCQRSWLWKLPKRTLRLAAVFDGKSAAHWNTINFQQIKQPLNTSHPFPSLVVCISTLRQWWALPVDVWQIPNARDYAAKRCIRSESHRLLDKSLIPELRAFGWGILAKCDTEYTEMFCSGSSGNIVRYILFISYWEGFRIPTPLVVILETVSRCPVTILEKICLCLKIMTVEIQW